MYRDAYCEFANRHLLQIGKEISQEAFDYLYDAYDGVTWYIQYVMNMLYTSLSSNKVFLREDIDSVVCDIISQHRFAYQTLLYQLTSKKKQVIVAIAHEGKTTSIMSQAFLRKYNISASTVQGAIKTLLDRDFITSDDGIYQISDKFLAKYLLH